MYTVCTYISNKNKKMIFFLKNWSFFLKTSKKNQPLLQRRNFTARSLQNANEDVFWPTGALSFFFSKKGRSYETKQTWRMRRSRKSQIAKSLSSLPRSSSRTNTCESILLHFRTHHVQAKALFWLSKSRTQVILYFSKDTGEINESGWNPSHFP